MREAAGANQSLSVAAEIQLRGELRDAQVVGAQRDDDIAGDRVAMEMVVIPDDARQA
jgi:hypothetical protein